MAAGGVEEGRVGTADGIDRRYPAALIDLEREAQKGFLLLLALGGGIGRADVVGGGDEPRRLADADWLGRVERQRLRDHRIARERRSIGDRRSVVERLGERSRRR